VATFGNCAARWRGLCGAPEDCRWYTQVVSLSVQVMQFPSDLSAFLKSSAVSPRERQRIFGDLIALPFPAKDPRGNYSTIGFRAFGGKANIAPNRSHVLR
jgi:hypothetical protein